MKLISIQILRAFGAWIVVITHWLGLMGDPGLYIWQTLTFFHWSGNCGVILFFILSGFIICYSTKYKKDFFIFWIHRLIRLIPLWWFLLLLFSVLLLSFPEVFEGYPVSVTKTSFLKSLFFLPVPSSTMPLIGQGWSLNVELLFYIFFSLSLLFKGRYTILICSIFLLSYSLLHSTLIPHIISINFGHIGYNVYFVYGMIIYYIFEKSEKSIYLLPPFIFLLIGIYGVKKLDAPPEGLALGLIVWAMISLEPWIRKYLKYFSWVVPLGDWSYSTYLNHGIFMFFSKWLYKNNIVSNIKLNFILYILMVLIFSYLTFFFLEKPANLFFKRIIENVYFKYMGSKKMVTVPV